MWGMGRRKTKSPCGRRRAGCTMPRARHAPLCGSPLPGRPGHGLVDQNSLLSHLPPSVCLLFPPRSFTSARPASTPLVRKIFPSLLSFLTLGVLLSSHPHSQSPTHLESLQVLINLTCLFLETYYVPTSLRSGCCGAGRGW